MNGIHIFIELMERTKFALLEYDEPMRSSLLVQSIGTHALTVADAMIKNNDFANTIDVMTFAMNMRNELMPDVVAECMKRDDVRDAFNVEMARMFGHDVHFDKALPGSGAVEDKNRLTTQELADLGIEEESESASDLVDFYTDDLVILIKSNVDMLTERQRRAFRKHFSAEHFDVLEDLLCASTSMEVLSLWPAAVAIVEKDIAWIEETLTLEQIGYFLEVETIVKDRQVREARELEGRSL